MLISFILVFELPNLYLIIEDKVKVLRVNTIIIFHTTLNSNNLRREGPDRIPSMNKRNGIKI